MGILHFTNGTKAEPLARGDCFTRGDELFRWPVVTDGMRQAVLDVLNSFSMSGTAVTDQFETEFARWTGAKYALGFNNGTSALKTAMYAAGLGAGDELICPGITYWASCAQALSLRASVVFADIEEETMCIDPDDIERRITPRTKAVMVVHYIGHPCDMDRIMPVARKHNLKVIEDVSHAQGSLYKGRMCGTLGDVAAMSCMSAKAFAIGEAGMLVTGSQEIYERAVMFGRIEHIKDVKDPELLRTAGIPMSGEKYRMHQMSSAVGLELLKDYPARIREIDEAMNYFADAVDQLPGLKVVRTAKGSGSTMGGWYYPACHYRPEELEGLSIGAFTRALTAEGVPHCKPGCNFSLFEHPLFFETDVYGEGHPVNRVPAGMDYPVCNRIHERIFSIPWFKHPDKTRIERFIAAYRKVAENYRELLPLDTFKNEHYSLTAFTPGLSKLFENRRKNATV